MSESTKKPVLYLPDLTWPEVKEALPKIKAAIIPVGSTEQHGPHGRFQTDYACAREFSLRLAECLYPEVLVTTPVAIGISEHHIHFPGTLSLRASTLIDVLMDIATSLYRHGLRRFFFVNGHGGNTPALTIATNRICHELGCKAAWATLPYDVIRDVSQAEIIKSPVTGHSCENEISLLLHLWPDAVRKEALSKGKVRPGEPESLARKLGIHEARFFDEVTENGALGDATLASAEFGRRAVALALEQMVPYMKEFMQK
jgi:creatinine amidohydrolase